MKSIRTKTTLLTVIAIIVAMGIAMFLGVHAIRKLGNTDTDQMLYLLCETGQKNLDYYFSSVEQSVEMVSSYAEEDLQSIETPSSEGLAAHVENVRSMFEKAVSQTNGVLTYYYRIDPDLSHAVKGFWYTNLDGEGFTEHEVTDITLYDTNDTDNLVWFTVPKATGSSIWLPPYITDNLDKRVISYNVPIYWNGLFIGVIGIEIDYSTMADQVDNITLYENGYAFINDDEGKIIYHPHMDVYEQDAENQRENPAGLVSEDTYYRYTYDGIEKNGVWLPLSNGMRLNVTVPVSEANGNWVSLVFEILIVSIIVLAIFIFLTLQFTGHITKPLRKLTEMAVQVNEGNYDCKLEYNGKDEVGILTRTFNDLVGDLKVYITDLNSLAYADALTSVKNKGAFDIYIREMQAKLEDNGEHPEFAIGIFDCDGLKQINDEYGHDKGNIFLKTASSLICRVYQHSPVFRLGGDEFAVILLNEDYTNRKDLNHAFEKKSEEINAQEPTPWMQVHISSGFAVYVPRDDRFVEDVVRRADKRMYDNKRKRKEHAQAHQQVHKDDRT